MVARADSHTFQAAAKWRSGQWPVASRYMLEVSVGSELAGACSRHAPGLGQYKQEYSNKLRLFASIKHNEDLKSCFRLHKINCI